MKLSLPLLNLVPALLIAATTPMAKASPASNTRLSSQSPAPQIDLSRYVRIARYNLPEPTRTTLPVDTPPNNLLCQEASGVAYNWDTDTLFVVGDGGQSITQVSKTAELIDTMTFALGGSPQGTDFYDPEGITYIGNGQFVFTEERDRQLVKCTYVGGSILHRTDTLTVKLGTYVDNIGTEGVSYDPLTGGYICLKEIDPIGIFQTDVDFEAGTASNGSPTTENSVNLFDPALLGLNDVADVFALSNLSMLSGQPQEQNLLVLSQEDGRIVNIDRSGNISSSLQIVSDVDNPLSVANQQDEGLTMDGSGVLYVVNENGGGGVDYPQLWIYAPTDAANQAPTGLVLNNAVDALAENTSTTFAIKVADIVVVDDGLGNNTFSVGGTDAGFFEIHGSELFLRSGTLLDYETKTSYSITVSVDDSSVGVTPDVTVGYTLDVINVEPETASAPSVIISEVAPWSSGNSPVGSDWFEVTNTGDNAVDITGWKMDDGSATFANAAELQGITSIAPGESVIFIETSDLETTKTAFLSTWFGDNPPANLQIGSYSGGGLGLSTGGDGVNLYNAGGALQASVTFGASPASAPRGTFDNTVGLNEETISTLNVAGVNGAFAAANDADEIGSPGYSAPGVLAVTEVAPWSSGNSPVGQDWFEVTNIGARPVDITDWKMDDSTESPNAAVPLTGITRIAPGESVIFIEYNTTFDEAKTAFINTWFGDNAPAGLQIGGYSGSGVGLSSNGDAVNLYDSHMPTPVRRANVIFGASPNAAPYATFDNSEGLDVVTLTQLSSIGTNGAFTATADDNEIGSPGLIANPSLHDSFSSWLGKHKYSSLGLDADTDHDGVKDVLEYVFNQNPDNPFDRMNMPQLVKSQGDMALQFTLNNSSVLNGSIQVSEDLIHWTDASEGLDYEAISAIRKGDETTKLYHLLSQPNSPVGPFTYTTPFTTQVHESMLGHIKIINHGLVGVGRLDGSMLDSFGETLGSSSGLDISLWSYDAQTGQFSGTFQVLPDRGFNADVDGVPYYSNYAARLHEIPFTFVPYENEAATDQGQIAPRYEGNTVKFTYNDSGVMKFTTGLNPTGTGTILGQPVGVASAANGPDGVVTDLISFDAEGIRLFKDGSGYVSDEYGTYLCRFNSSKEITHITELPAVAQPHNPVGEFNFDSVNAPANGRRNNQGLEGIAVSPDETRLFALMQSALVQDTGSGKLGRYNTRLFVYDIVGPNREAPVLIGEYVVQLPRYDTNGDGSGLDNTAAQSEIVAISNHQFLMLPRDGNGLGTGSPTPIVVKEVDLVDFNEATNILGQFDAEGEQVSPGAVLDNGITPAQSTVVINLASVTDLAKFGLNTNTANPDSNTLNEKLEGMALVPDLSTPDPEDYFLFVGNDNDFESNNVKMINAEGSMDSLGDQSAAGIVNDVMFYAYRITIHPVTRKFYRYQVDTGANP